MAIAPGGAVNRRQDDFGRHPANMGQIVFQHALLIGHLGGEFHMLHRTAAAHAKMRAARRGAHKAGVEHLHRVGVFVAGFFAVAAVAHRLIRQAAVDEQGFAIDVGYATAFKVEGFNTGDRLRVCHARVCYQWAKTAILAKNPAVFRKIQPARAQDGMRA